MSFQDVGVDQARRNYEASCAANGFPFEEVARVEDLRIDEQVAVRVYTPEGATGGGLLFLHGGGWVIGSLDTHDLLCRHVANLVRRTVVAVDYRLAPESPFPAALDDSRVALDWLRGNADSIGVNAGDLAIMGDSAGGQMATVLAGEVGVQLVAQILLYPVTDFDMGSGSYGRVTTGFPLTAASMRWFADCYLGPGQDPGVRELSPLRYPPRTDTPPAFVCTVGHDPLADEGIAYAALLAGSGVLVEHHHLPGYAHGLFTSAGLLPEAGRTLSRVADFLASDEVAARAS